MYTGTFFPSPTQRSFFPDSIDDFTLYSNPPDYINDYSEAIALVDIYNKKTTILPLPFTNGTAGGAIEIDGDTLIASLASKSNGAGLFTYDLASKAPSSGPAVTVQGYANVIRRVQF